MGRLLGKIKTGRYRPLHHSLSNEAKHLVKKMLVVEPHKRITVSILEKGREKRRGEEEEDSGVVVKGGTDLLCIDWYR